MDYYCQLIGKRLTNEISREEDAELNKWINESNKNNTYYQQTVLAWELAMLESDKGLKNRVKDTYKRKIQESKTRKKMRILINVAAAACISILMVLQAVDEFSWLRTVGYECVEANEGVLSYVLPDGSVVKINGESRIKYKKNFNSNQRYVYLEGEAFFEVKKNPVKPFVINAKDSKICVLGTSFNVNAYDDKKGVCTSVLTGRVEFSSEKYEETKIVLLPGDKANISNKSLELCETDCEKDFYWVRKKMLFEGEDLESVTKKIKRIYGVYPEFKTQDLKGIKITASFDNEKIEEIVKILNLTNDLKIELDGRIMKIGR
ncbi:MAG: FecR family protein [Marinifilaceae bacterium]|jgi:ferric-dicitrate binding protein FerR (iron transport regulator)|nr:FecR family protein [Marinifilaceae bacterium]